MQNIPSWLYNTTKYKYKDFSEDESLYSLPENSQIKDLNEFINIVTISKEWNYENEGKVYPIDVYLYCLTNTKEVLDFIKNKEEYDDIQNMINGENDTLQNYFGSIAIYLKNKEKINENSIMYLEKIAPIELSFFTEKILKIENNELISEFLYSIKGENKILRFVDFEWKESIMRLNKNFLENIKTIKRLQNYKKELEKEILEHEDEEFVTNFKNTISKIKELKKEFEIKIGDDVLNFYVELDDLFSYSKYTKITDQNFVPNVILYSFILELNKFAQESD